MNTLILNAVDVNNKFKASKYRDIPKPLIKVDNGYMIIKSMSSFPLEQFNKIIVICNKSDNKNNKIKTEINKNFKRLNNLRFLELEEPDDKFKIIYNMDEYIHNTDELFIFDTDRYFIDYGFAEYMNQIKTPGFLSIFKSNKGIWDFITFGKNFYVSDISDQCISNFAVTGLNYFNDFQLYKLLYDSVIKNNQKVNTVNLYKEMINRKLVIQARPVAMFCSFHTPDELEYYNKGKKYGY